MSGVQFSTSVGQEAARRIREAIPDASDELVAYVEQLTTAGLIRVGDPMMYEGTAPIYPTPICSAQEGMEIGLNISRMLDKPEGRQR
jgi:hypothetical protein